MKRFLPLLFVPALSGCLTATSPSVSHWLLEFDGYKAPVASKARYDAARVVQISVAAPYDSVGLTVLRANGSVAFDPYNDFAARPSQLLKGVLFEAAVGSGLFESVVGSSSTMSTSVSLEAVVSRLALDCRKEGERRAVASVLLRLVNRRESSVVCKGTGTADAADGNYGKALSTAVSRAFEEAFGKIK